MLARLLFACLLFAVLAVMLAFVPQPTGLWDRVAREYVAMCVAGIMAVALYRGR